MPRLSSNKFWVIVARGIHPFPSRTRKLSPSAPMVLHAQVCGRVGSCPVMSEAPAERLGLLLFWGGAVARASRPRGARLIADQHFIGKQGAHDSVGVYGDVEMQLGD